jgi:hypothetical protein
MATGHDAGSPRVSLPHNDSRSDWVGARGIAAPPDRWAWVDGVHVVEIAVSVVSGAVRVTAETSTRPLRLAEWLLQPEFALYVADQMASHARYVITHPTRRGHTQKGRE